MKRLFILLLPLLLLLGCSSQPDFSTPESTFENLLTAIHAKDIQAYEACWHTQKAGSEGLVATLPSMPLLWDGLQEMYKPGTQLSNRKESEEDGIKIASYDVQVANGDGTNRTSGVSFAQEDGKWKMWHW
jgi:hypothetical protein